MTRNSWMRGVALAVSGAMFLNCGGAGLFSAVTTVVGLMQGNPLPPPFTQEPGRIWYGSHPGRNSDTRGGFYSERALRGIEKAARKWRRNVGGLVAGDSPVPTLAGFAGGGGGGIPGDGKTGGGFTGGGVINTSNGNMMKPFTLLSWPSVGELDFSLTLYHNSISDYCSLLRAW